MTNFSLMKVEGKWMVGARWRLNYPISTTVGAGLPNQLSPNYPELPSSNSEQPKKLVEGILRVIVISNLLSYPPFYSILNINKQNLSTLS